MCQKAGISCTFSPLTSQDVAELSSRVDWLSTIVDNYLPEDINIRSFSTGSDPQSIIGLRSSRAQSSSPATSEMDSDEILGQKENFLSNMISPHRKFSFAYIHELSSGITPIDLAQAYFKYQHRSQPFLNEDEILAQVSSFILGSKHGNIDITLASVKVYLVLTLGSAMLHRARKISYNVFARFHVPYDEILQLCLSSATDESIQVLLLLVFHSTHTSNGRNPWVLTNLLCHHAVSLKLNAAVPLESGLTLQEIETRSRIFWSVLSIDRYVSVSYGLPFTITADINIPLPSITVEEFAASEQSHYLTTLQVTRQNIALRELEAQIYSLIHREPTSQDRHRLLNQIRLQIENWYTQGCLLARMDTRDNPVHNTIGWLNFSYYRLLTLLHLPSPFNSDLEPPELIELHLIVRKYIHFSWNNFQSGCYSLHHFASNILLVVCRTMLHCYSRCDPESLIELDEAISECLNILKEFDPSWVFAKRCGSVFQRFAKLVMPEHRLPEFSDHTSRADVLDSIIEQSDMLIMEALGPSSVYNYLNNSSRSAGLAE